MYVASTYSTNGGYPVTVRLQDHCLSQAVKKAARNARTLDLLFTNSRPRGRMKGMPSIGKADHDIIYVEYDIKAKRTQQAPREIHLYNRADMEGLRTI